jgi:hypothetical protein
VKSNGWTFYDSEHLDADNWPALLNALAAAGKAARARTRSWPQRPVHEHIDLHLRGDLRRQVPTLREALEIAASDDDVQAVRHNLSQRGKEEEPDPTGMRGRNYQLTAFRGGGLTLYANTAVEGELPAMLAAVRQPAQRALATRRGWRRLAVVVTITNHGVIATVLGSGILAGLTWLWTHR